MKHEVEYAGLFLLYSKGLLKVQCAAFKLLAMLEDGHERVLAWSLLCKAEATARLPNDCLCFCLVVGRLCVISGALSS